MRRILVILLILLFPLNVLALSVSLAQQEGTAVHAAAALPAGDAFAADADTDIDPDEPPSVADLHDQVHQDRSPHPAGAGAGLPPPHDAAPCCRSIPPPIKPPRLA